MVCHVRGMTEEFPNEVVIPPLKNGRLYTFKIRWYRCQETAAVHSMNERSHENVVRESGRQNCVGFENQFPEG